MVIYQKKIDYKTLVHKKNSKPLKIEIWSDKKKFKYIGWSKKNWQNLKG